ncbi:Smr domain-containing protein C11H11.03c [Auxenochlorella protothecoides]|uniref:Smr domain-containing protein C11H11.03c n=1 Tax=Auxenochlorella protothecoides TaxID=3075 RepID=A0A087SGQ2_AUXPR|nr:Smr domain-containing protein C11H11.03c [Auxenochlorella protothecoides]KFM24906.1 Smr domain-containing protein C11H11.03c [Auxenochlorella protothecoides]
MLDLEAQARLRVKAVTAVVTTITAASLILFDWDAASGQRTAFSSIRPTIKSWLNQVYGATQAYLSGNRALAKQLSAAGREAATEMQAAHAAAATALFEGRNLGEGGRETPGCRTLDLHGLHVAEALERVRAAVKAQRVQRGTVLRLVVGEGRHGKVPARLPAAVRQLLTEEGVRWKEPYAGLLQASF